MAPQAPRTRVRFGRLDWVGICACFVLLPGSAAWAAPSGAPAPVAMILPDESSVLWHNEPSARRIGSFLAGAGLLSYAATRLEDPGFLNGSGEWNFLDGAIDVGNSFGDATVLGAGTVGLWAVGWVAQSPELQRTSRDLVRGMLVSTAMVWTIKLALNRRRPNGGPYSFPSGHAAAAFTVATILDEHFGSAVALSTYTLAVGTMLGRMEDRKHYLSDVIFGAAIGVAAGHLVTGSAGPAGVLNHVTLNPRGVGVSLRF